MHLEGQVQRLMSHSENTSCPAKPTGSGWLSVLKMVKLILDFGAGLVKTQFSVRVADNTLVNSSAFVFSLILTLGLQWRKDSKRRAAAVPFVSCSAGNSRPKGLCRTTGANLSRANSCSWAVLSVELSADQQCHCTSVRLQQKGKTIIWMIITPFQTFLLVRGKDSRESILFKDHISLISTRSVKPSICPFAGLAVIHFSPLQTNLSLKLLPLVPTLQFQQSLRSPSGFEDSFIPQSSSKTKRPFLHFIQHCHDSVAKASAFDSCSLALTSDAPSLTAECSRSSTDPAARGTVSPRLNTPSSPSLAPEQSSSSSCSVSMPSPGLAPTDPHPAHAGGSQAGHSTPDADGSMLPLLLDSKSHLTRLVTEGHMALCSSTHWLLELSKGLGEANKNGDTSITFQ
ncbi:hypothetical protein DUI87_35195 [Hirundo rustica rustica]|uniref:Uncharacterized protein n=1 Tax=Hirundo rustica rustica TaxID=333673 RepID=A0A3M0IN89_HIRRU|nr:hypothetical protein DUI87_35195 [Hirundo rustica rustica]